MAEPAPPREVDTIMLAKAAAMVLMVANHALLSQALFGVPGLYGGLNAMLAISGATMASSCFAGSTADTLRAFWRFGWRLVRPCLALALVWDTIILVIGARHVTSLRYLAELGLFSNWLWPDKLALFPMWYPQAITQMLLGLALVFWLGDLTPRIRRAPLRASALALAAALALALASHALWNSAYLQDRLPHLIVWNFITGWLIWAVRRQGRLTVPRKIGLSAVLLGTSALAYLPTGADHGLSRAIWFPLVLLPTIWWNRVRLPAVVARPVLLVAQSVFSIFLWHFYVFGLVEEPLKAIGFAHPLVLAVLKTVLGLVVPVLAWVLWAAFRRTRRHWQRANRPLPRWAGWLP